jgi:hypothetical protein
VIKSFIQPAPGTLMLDTWILYRTMVTITYVLLLLYRLAVNLGTRTFCRKTERHFAERHFAERHFAERTLCRRTFCRTDVLPNGQFAERTFCRTDSFPKGQLAQK